MFWSKAKRIYRNINSDDPDIRSYFKIMNELQVSGYKGITGYIQDLGHKFIAKYTSQGKTLEIGFGSGRQAMFFKGNPDNYYPIELNDKYVNAQWDKFKNARIADAANLPFNDNFFDNVVSIYNLEHIKNIDKVLNEVKRVLKPSGKLLVALPCEDGFAWNLGRELTTRRIFSKKYKINYDKVIAFEHIHNFLSIKSKLDEFFISKKCKYFPFRFPSYNLNLIFCGTFMIKSS